MEGTECAAGKREHVNNGALVGGGQCARHGPGLAVPPVPPGGPPSALWMSSAGPRVGDYIILSFVTCGHQPSPVRKEYVSRL